MKKLNPLYSLDHLQQVELLSTRALLDVILRIRKHHWSGPKLVDFALLERELRLGAELLIATGGLNIERVRA